MFNELKNTGLSADWGSGGLTKYNRNNFHVPKERWLDALCVGNVQGVANWGKLNVLRVNCCGRGAYQRTRTDKYGFPSGFRMRQKKVHGFASGDMVRAVVPKGKYKGTHVEKSIRSENRFVLYSTTRKKSERNLLSALQINHKLGLLFLWMGNLQFLLGLKHEESLENLVKFKTRTEENKRFAVYHFTCM